MSVMMAMNMKMRVGEDNDGVSRIECEGLNPKFRPSMLDVCDCQAESGYRTPPTYAVGTNKEAAKE